MTFPSPKSRLFLAIVFSFVMTASLPAAETTPKSPIQLLPGDDLTAKELAGLMDVYVWKFKVELPENASQVSTSLSFFKKGKSQGGFGLEAFVSPETPRDLLIAIVPIEGTLAGADNVCITISGFNMTGKSILENPLKDLGIGMPHTPESNPNGSFSLIGGYKNNTVKMPLSNADTVIVLEIETEEK